MALMNRHLEPMLETVFMMPAEQYTYLSSRLTKEVFYLGGDVTGLVPRRWSRRCGASRKQELEARDVRTETREGVGVGDAEGRR
jgi:pantetheine-phosphate adenylyltransferase